MNKKKNLIFVAIILILIIMIGIISKIKFADTKEEKNNIEVIGKETFEAVNEVKNEIVTQNIIEENSIVALENVVTEEKVIETSVESPKEVTEKIEESIKPVESRNEDPKPVVQEQEIITTQTQEVIIEKPIEQPTTLIVSEAPKVETQPVVTQPVTTTPTEEYRYNDAMTQNIVNIINSNPSEFMQMDGFSIVIDSSITALTNQFTFSEERVKNKIAFKAGTIRVYAQDYYFNR